MKIGKSFQMLEGGLADIKTDSMMISWAYYFS
jgi:hypothetical protein